LRPGASAFGDRSRRPLHSPRRLADAVEARILAVRDAPPAWEVRKIVALLRREGVERASAHDGCGFVQCRRIPAAPPLAGQALESEGFYRLCCGLPKPRPVAGQARPASL